MTLLWQSGHDLYKYVTYEPQGGNARVKAARETIYHISGDEAMHAAVDTYLVNTLWVRVMSWKNDTDAEHEYNVEYKTELRVTQGSEVNNGYSVAAAYEGITVTIEQQHKVFKSTETTETKTTSVRVTIPPRSQVIFYQRQYNFKCSMSFILDAWGQEWNVGSWGGYDLSRKDCTVEVSSEDYATLETELDGTTTGTMDVATVGAIVIAGITRKRDTCTERCKSRLEDMHV